MKDRPGYLGSNDYWFGGGPFGAFSRRKDRGEKRRLQRQQAEERRLQKQQQEAQRVAQQQKARALQEQLSKKSAPKPSPIAVQKAAPTSIVSQQAELARLQAELTDIENGSSEEMPEMPGAGMSIDSSGGSLPDMTDSSMTDEEAELALQEEAGALAEKLAAQYRGKARPIEAQLPQQAIIQEQKAVASQQAQAQRPGFIGAIMDALFGPPAF